MFKRITALFLSLVLLFTLVGTQAFAADDAGAAAAALEAGKGYWFGNGPDGYDMKKAQAAFRRAANLGSADGWFWLGMLADYGVEEGHYQQAFAYYRQAAELGSDLGLFGLGWAYEAGYSGERNLEKCLECYEKAIDHGCETAYIGMANLCLKGYFSNADGQTAAAYCKAAEQSDDWYTRNTARFMLVSIYRLGAEGIEIDHNEALYWLQKAADDGFPEAYDALGLFYSRGWNGTSDPKNYAQGITWYEKAAACGLPHNLGFYYEGGYGVQMDKEHAVELYKQSAEGGRDAVWALGSLAFCYLYGEGVQVDFAAARDYANRCFAAAGVDPSGVEPNVSSTGVGVAKWVLCALDSVNA